jgi:porphobilinogen deaminase
MPSLEGFTLAFLENIYQDNNVELLQGNVATRLDVEKLRDASS